MSWGGTEWEMSIRVAPGLIPRTTPFIAPANQPPTPKSVVRVMIEVGMS